MTKYKFIGETRENREHNKVYDGESKMYTWSHSVLELALKFPGDWELINEKSPEELLIEEAKLRYPIGTEFYSALPGDLNPARLKCNGGYRFQEDVHGCKNVIWNKDHSNRECGFLYCNGTWAEIINKNTMCTEKTIIGYYLIKTEYAKATELILGVPFNKQTPGLVTVDKCIQDLKKAGVLDLWFEPVYKSEYPDITINGYKGEFFDNYVKFGCAEIHKQIFLSFDELNARINDGDDPIGAKTNKEIELVTIGRGLFTKDQIKEIAEYYLNK